MPTFLTTSKMHPALAARVEASLRANRRGAKELAPRWVSAFRVVVIVAAVAVVSGIASLQKRDRMELEAARAALVDSAHAHAAQLTDDDRAMVARSEMALVHLAGPYEGDVIAPEMRANEAAIFARPAAYVRGPLATFTRPGRIAEGAAASVKDALVACLVDPPASRMEKAVMKKVRVVYAGGAAFEHETSTVARFHDAEAGLPILLPTWEERARAAKDAKALARIREEANGIALDGAVRALKAQILIAAADEPPDGRSATELDGETSHDVRVAIIDLTNGKTLLRQRIHADPSNITIALRAEFASGIDGCGIGYEVRDRIRKP